MKQKLKNLLIILTLVLATFCFLSTVATAKIPDEWIVISDYDITLGDYYSGQKSDTYYNDGKYLKGTCFYFWFPYPRPVYSNSFSISFDFGNLHYKRVRIDATTDQFGHSGVFCVDAVYTSGRVRLGCFEPGTTGYFTTSYHKILDKVILEYWQNGVPGQRMIFIDEIRALWTYYR